MFNRRNIDLNLAPSDRRCAVHKREHQVRISQYFHFSEPGSLQLDDWADRVEMARKNIRIKLRKTCRFLVISLPSEQLFSWEGNGITVHFGRSHSGPVELQRRADRVHMRRRAH